MGTFLIGLSDKHQKVVFLGGANYFEIYDIYPNYVYLFFWWRGEVNCFVFVSLIFFYSIVLTWPICLTHFFFKGRNYFVNLHSGETRWDAPDNVFICVECEWNFADRVCDQCRDEYCNYCFGVRHAKGSRQFHTWIDMVSGKEYDGCQVCQPTNPTPAIVLCKDCQPNEHATHLHKSLIGSKFCQYCFDHTHAEPGKEHHSHEKIALYI